MKGTFVRTIVVLALLAGLGGYAWFVERPKPARSGDEPETPKERVFADLVRQRIEGLSWQPQGGEAVRLAKGRSGWRLAEPVAAAADQAEVESLLGSLENLEATQVAAEAPADLAEFGLAEAKNRIEITVMGEKGPRVLFVGEKVPASSDVFARLLSRNRVFTIPAYVVAGFEKKAFDFRDRDLLKLERDAVRAVEVSGPEGQYKLERSGPEWLVKAPLRTRASRYAVDGFVGLLEGLRMERVAAEDARALGPFGLDKPARRVSLLMRDGQRRELELGSAPEDKKLHARVGGSSMVAVIPGAIADDLGKGLDHWRAKRLLELATYQVTHLEIHEVGKVRKLERQTVKSKDGVDEQRWKRVSPDTKDVEARVVEDALFKLGGTEVQAFVDAPKPLSAYGLAPPRLKVMLRLENSPALWLELGEAGGVWHARRPDDDALLALDPVKADELQKAFAAL